MHITLSEHEFHKASDVDLKDVWEDVPPPPWPAPMKRGQKDLSYGRAKGHTWGYQRDLPGDEPRRYDRRRTDKFFYTRSIDTVTPDEVHDVCGRLGRFGINLRTEVEVWEDTTTTWSIVGGAMVHRPEKRYYSDEHAATILGSRERKMELARKKVEYWVSSHFGIAIGIKIL